MKQEILMVKIHNGLKDGKTPYEATRKHWKMNTDRHPYIKYVIGLDRKKVVSVFEPVNWYIVKDGPEKGRSYFEGLEAGNEVYSLIHASKELLMNKFGSGAAIAYASLTDLEKY